MKSKVVIKVVIIITIIIIALFCIPVPYHLKDGGSVEYKALLYKVTDVHCLNPDMDVEQPYLEGIVIEIFGVEIFNNVK